MFAEEKLKELLTQLKKGLKNFTKTQELPTDSLEAVSTLLEKTALIYSPQTPLEITEEKTTLREIDACLLQYFILMCSVYGTRQQPLYRHYFACRKISNDPNQDLAVVCNDLFNPKLEINEKTSAALNNLMKSYGNFSNCDAILKAVFLNYLKIYIQALNIDKKPIASEIKAFFTTPATSLTLIDLFMVLTSLEGIHFFQGQLNAEPQNINFQENLKLHEKDLAAKEPALIEKIKQTLENATAALPHDVEIALLSYLTYAIKQNQLDLLPLFLNYVKKFKREELLNLKVHSHNTKIPATLLHWATVFCPLPMIQELLAMGAKPDIPFDIEEAGGLSALGLAMLYQEDAVAAALLEKYPPEKLTAKTKFGTYLHLLASRGQDATVNTIHRRGTSLLPITYYQVYALKAGLPFDEHNPVQINANQFSVQLPPTGITIRATASKELCGATLAPPNNANRAPLTEELLRRCKIDVNTHNNAEFSPLTLAALAATIPTTDKADLKKFIAILLRQDACFSSGQLAEVTLLSLQLTSAEITQMTAIFADPELHDLMVQVTPQIVPHEYKHQTLPYFSWAHLLAFRGENLLLEKWLQQYPADITLADGDKCDPLHYAVMTNQIETVALLFKLKPDLKINPSIHSFFRELRQSEFTQFRFSDDIPITDKESLLKKMHELAAYLSVEKPKQRGLLMSNHSATQLTTAIKQRDLPTVINSTKDLTRNGNWVEITPQSLKTRVPLRITQNVYCLEILRQTADIRLEGIKAVEMLQEFFSNGNSCYTYQGNNQTLLALLDYAQEELVKTKNPTAARTRWLSLFSKILFDSTKRTVLNKGLGHLYALFKLFHNNKWPEITQQLLACPDFCCAIDKKGNTFLHLAVADKDPVLLAMFLNSNIDKDIKNDDNQTAAECAQNEPLLKACFEKQKAAEKLHAEKKQAQEKQKTTKKLQTEKQKQKTTEKPKKPKKSQQPLITMSSPATEQQNPQLVTTPTPEETTIAQPTKITEAVSINNAPGKTETKTNEVSSTEPNPTEKKQVFNAWEHGTPFWKQSSNQSAPSKTSTKVTTPPSKKSANSARNPTTLPPPGQF